MILDDPSFYSWRIVPTEVTLPGTMTFTVQRDVIIRLGKFVQAVSFDCPVAIEHTTKNGLTLMSRAMKGQLSDMLPKKRSRICMAEYRSDQLRGKRTVWHGSTRWELLVGVCGSWVFPENVTDEPEDVTCPQCSDTLVQIAVEALTGNTKYVVHGTVSRDSNIRLGEMVAVDRFGDFIPAPSSDMAVGTYLGCGKVRVKR